MLDQEPRDHKQGRAIRKPESRPKASGPGTGAVWHWGHRSPRILSGQNAERLLQTLACTGGSKQALKCTKDQVGRWVDMEVK